ncbi:EF-hand domain-containing protein [Lentilitoribacter sp. EG35]|uniref:EF-hand domain-containing protein n=1 Tax=Lentilitoribacter sp. EG35 TaxID=3234192 RepID=UPI00345FEAD4
MKIVLTTIALSAMALTGASALNFTSVDDTRGDANGVYASQAGDGLVSIHEANRAGISAIQFHAADANNDGKLSPTEFRNLG